MMLRTVEAIIDQDWVVRLLEPLRLSTSSRALVTILDQEIAPDGDESAMLSDLILCQITSNPFSDPFGRLDRYQ